jgi:hypothetical protein
MVAIGYFPPFFGAVGLVGSAGLGAAALGLPALGLLAFSRWSAGVDVFGLPPILLTSFFVVTHICSNTP